MAYPRNAASPQRISIGAVILIADGAVQISGVAVKVIPFGAAEATGGGTVAYSADGVVMYTPTQGETDYTSMIFVASKSGCIPANATVVTSAESTAGTVRIGSIAANAVNAAAIADGAIDTATFASGTTIPRVTLADTVTTNTDMRGTDGANTIAPTNLSAAQVRTELATELGRIDASISSRSTYAGGAVASVAAAVVLDSASVTAVQSGLATSAAVTAVAGDVTTILSRVTATVATLWGALVEMISGTTPNRRFTAKALELGPGGAGGGDATAANQVAILAALTGVEVIQVASPNVSGNLVLTQGDTYDGIANAKASWVVATDYTTGWAVLLTIRDSNDVLVYAVAGTVASATSITVSIIAPTGLTMTGCPGQWQGKFDVQLTKTGSIKTIALGACYINEDQSR